MMNSDNVLDFLDASLIEPSDSAEATIDELTDRDRSWLARVEDEFAAGFRLMASRGPCVTVFGSARVGRDSPAYAAGVAVGRELANAGFTVVTGGGPGLMEAANRGAVEAGGTSIGLGIKLGELEPPNLYTPESISFKYFFVRKVMLLKYAAACVMLPGGLGTLDELFETLNLIQTAKIKPVPVVLVGSHFWQGLIEWMRVQLHGMKLISPHSLDLFLLEDDPAAVARAIVRWMETQDPACFDRPAGRDGHQQASG